MQISSVSPNQAELTACAIRWLNRVLDSPDMHYSTFPSELKGYLYVEGSLRLLISGNWQITADSIYLPGSSRAVEPITKLSVLAAIAAMTKASQDTNILARITQKLVILLNETAVNVYSSVITSTQKPTRLAINNETLQIAAEINGTWLLTSGISVEVTDKWITMDF